MVPRCAARSAASPSWWKSPTWATTASGLPYPVNINQIPQSKLGLLPVQNYRPYPQYSAINGNYFDVLGAHRSSGVIPVSVWVRRW